MPTEKKRITILPDTAALAVLGRDIRPDPDSGRWTQPTEAVNGALAEYAALVERATRELDAVLSRAEWNAVADVMNGCADLFDYGGPVTPPLLTICANLTDGDDLDGLGKKWGVDVSDLVARLSALTPVHGYAVMAAVRWFWTHSDDINHSKHDWWKVAFRKTDD